MKTMTPGWGLAPLEKPSYFKPQCSLPNLKICSRLHVCSPHWSQWGFHHLAPISIGPQLPLPVLPKHLESMCFA